MAILKRGLRDLRTLSGRVDRVSLPYRAYMKISCLEMEKSRKVREKEAARQNIANIDVRLAEIEVEKAALLKALQEVTDKKKEEPGAGEPKNRQVGGGFKIRY